MRSHLCGCLLVGGCGDVASYGWRVACARFHGRLPAVALPPAWRGCRRLVHALFAALGSEAAGCSGTDARADVALMPTKELGAEFVVTVRIDPGDYWGASTWPGSTASRTVCRFAAARGVSSLCTCLPSRTFSACPRLLWYWLLSAQVSVVEVYNEACVGAGWREGAPWYPFTL